MPILRERKRIRYPEYDYSSDGYYFITICTKDRNEWFGTIKKGAMTLNRHGNAAKKMWNEIPSHFNNIKLDEFVIYA